MLKLKIQVPKDRIGLATARLTSKGRYLWRDYAAASTAPAIAAAHDNPSCDPLLPWGHPRAGVYYLAGHAQSPDVPVAEYGRRVFLFQDRVPHPWSATRYRAGELLAYGGAPGADKHLRRTQGGIRLSNDMIKKIVTALKSNHGLILEVKPVARRLWWTFWLVKRSTPPLSITEPPLLQAPHDELSLTQRLMAQFKLAPVYPADRPDSSRDDTSSSTTDRSPSSSSPSETYAGQGGTSGGAGASGSWAGSGAAAGVAAGAGVALAAGAVYTAYAMADYAADSSGSSGGGGGWGDSSSSSSSSSSNSDSGGGSSSDSGGGGGDSGGGGGD